MKIKKKQEFKSSGVLTLLGLVSFSMILIATPWNRQMQDSQVELALQKAEVVGYQVVQIYREASKNSEISNEKTRFPASIKAEPADMRSTGTMGSDPWGQPYHYRILSKSAQSKVRILVWSSGPNKKAETANLDNEESSITEQPIYAGDDVGVLLSMSQN